MIAILVWGGLAAAEPNWAEMMPRVEAGDRAAVVVRVLKSPAGQAPMVHMKVGTDSYELACTDDGSFPDPAPDDGVFHCARLLEPALIATGEWSARFSVRGGNGEDQFLGELVYQGEGGFHFATVTLDEPEAASSARLDLSPKASDLPEEAVMAEPTPPLDAGGTPPAPPEPPPMAQRSGPGPSEASGPGGSLGFTLAWAILAAAGGWAFGRRRRSTPLIEGGSVLAVVPLDGSGPEPPEAVLIAATDPTATCVRIVRALTSSRRVVLVGTPPSSLQATGHDVVLAEDPDVEAVATLVKRLSTDGGVPPVVVVQGSEALIDTSGASSDPRVDLMRGLPASVWIVFIDGSDATAMVGTVGWSHDPQAGWSRL